MRHFTPDFNRNMPDAVAKEVARKGGVIQVSFGTVFLDAKAAKAFDQRRWTAEDMRRDGKSDAEIEAFTKQWNKDHPAPVVHMDLVLDQIDYAVKLVGIDHVGIGSDSDLKGYDDMPEDQRKQLMAAYKSSYAFRTRLDTDGFDHPRKVFDLTEALLRRGYSDENIAAVLGGNFARLLAATWK
jgi:microsomal dipeptidase-like Zn-dependent dipeptidase